MAVAEMNKGREVDRPKKSMQDREVENVPEYLPFHARLPAGHNGQQFDVGLPDIDGLPFIYGLPVDDGWPIGVRWNNDSSYAEAPSYCSAWRKRGERSGGRNPTWPVRHSTRAMPGCDLTTRAQSSRSRNSGR